MKRLVFGLLTAAALGSALPATALTYSTGPQSFVFDDGHGPRTLNYSFVTTTDDTIGLLSLANIVSFSWSASLDAASFTVTDSNAFLKIIWSGLIATPTELYFDPSYNPSRVMFTHNGTSESIQLLGAGASQFGRPQFIVQFANGDGGGTFDFKSVSLGTVAAPPAVPEPATWGMMIAGFGVAGAALRRRKVASVVRFA
jgi:hypothetical protein